MRKKIMWTLPILVLSIVFGGVFKTYAGTGENGRGWLWSGNPDTAWMGWASMNSLGCDANGDGANDVDADGVSGPDCGAGSTASYGVNIPVTSGPVSGYAWSSNYGWISFNAGDLAGCPAGSCSAQRGAGNNLTGWARILSICDSSDAGFGCSLGEVNTNSGGWAGFISLDSGTVASAFPYGITINTTTDKMGGYAWSNELGWIDFSRASLNIPKYLTVCASSPLNPNSLNLTLGGSQNLIAYYGPQQNVCGGSNTNVTSSVSFTSSAAGIVSMSGAAATGAGTGSATITATCTNATNCGSSTDTLPATVSVAACAVDPNSITACNNSIANRCPDESCWDNCGNFINVGTSTSCSGSGWHEVTPN